MEEYDYCENHKCSECPAKVDCCGKAFAAYSGFGTAFVQSEK